MNFWNKKNTIEFFNDEPSIIETFPIIEHKDLKLEWVKRARQDFQNIVKDGGDKKPGFGHLVRCPGIFELFKYGYVIRLHRDIIIEPHGEQFSYSIAKTSPEGLDVKGQLHWNPNILPKAPWAHPFILKITTGWHVIAPKGIKFMMLPIAYPDTFDFTSTLGIFNPAECTQVNFQLWWTAEEKKTLLRAGTPLGVLVPLSEKKYQMIQRSATVQDKLWVSKMDSIFSSSFWPHTVRNKIIELYNNYWKKQ